MHSPSPARASAARRTIEALSEGVDVWEAFFDNVQIGLALVDLTAHYMRVNTTYAALLGRPPEDLVGQPVLSVVRPGAGVEALLDELVRGRRSSVQAEAPYLTPTGQQVWLLHGLSVVLGQDGAPEWFAVSAQDITERRRVEQELRDLTVTLTEQAVRDPLTGLANRTLVEERLRSALARDARSGGTTGLLFLDLDGFKGINDRYGHGVGDEVLRVLARRLQACVRPSDTVARLGGDEFVVLAEGTRAPDGLQQLAERLRAAVAQPLLVGDLDLHLGVSIGAAVSHAGDSDPGRLLAQADEGMYGDKRRRRTL